MQLQFKYGWMLSCWYHTSIATLCLNSQNNICVNKLCTAELHLMHQFQTFLDQETLLMVHSCFNNLSAGLLECVPYMGLFLSLPRSCSKMQHLTTVVHLHSLQVVLILAMQHYHFENCTGYHLASRCNSNWELSAVKSYVAQVLSIYITTYSSDKIYKGVSNWWPENVTCRPRPPQAQLQEWEMYHKTSCDGNVMCRVWHPWSTRNVYS